MVIKFLTMPRSHHHHNLIKREHTFVVIKSRIKFCNQVNSAKKSQVISVIVAPCNRGTLFLYSFLYTTFCNFAFVPLKGYYKLKLIKINLNKKSFLGTVRFVQRIFYKWFLLFLNYVLPDKFNFLLLKNNTSSSQLL